MSYFELYTNEDICYFGGKRGNKESKSYILGAPLDITASFRSGSRFAPTKIREVSQYIETYSIRLDKELDEVEYFDQGNIITYPNIKDSIEVIMKVINSLRKIGKNIIVLGGEHTITLGVINGLDKTDKVGLVIFDAHFDLRDEYPPGYKVTHATVMRRILDFFPKDNVLFLGVRAFSKEELFFAKSSRIRFLTSLDLMKRLDSCLEILKEFLRSFDEVYISIDMDVFDPGFAPGVQNPEPEGLVPTIVLDLVQVIYENCKIIGADIVECSPPYDKADITSILAARLVCEILYTFT